MNLKPFGFSKNIGKPEKETISEVPAVYENKTTDYRRMVEKYKNFMLNIPNEMQVYGKNLTESQYSSIQMAVAFTYLKEQTEKSIELLEYIREEQEKSLLDSDDLSYDREQTLKALSILEEIKNEQSRNNQESLETTLQTASDLAYIKEQSEKTLGTIENIKEQSEKTLGTIENIKEEQNIKLQEAMRSIVELWNNREQSLQSDVQTLELLADIRAEQSKKVELAQLAFQTSQDMNYVKEQSVKTIELLSIIKSEQEKKAQEQMENLITSIIETNFKLDEIDKGVVGRVSDMSSEVQRLMMYQNKQIMTQTEENMDRISRDVRKNSNLIWFVIGFQLMLIAGMAAIILYILEIDVFSFFNFIGN